MLFWHLMRAAAARTFCTAGKRSPTSTAMIAMTTSNSISVNAPRLEAYIDDRLRFEMKSLRHECRTGANPDRERRPVDQRVLRIFAILPLLPLRRSRGQPVARGTS